MSTDGVNNLSAEQLERMPTGPISQEQLAHKTVRVMAVQGSGSRRGYTPNGPQEDPSAKVIEAIDRGGREKADLVVLPRKPSGNTTRSACSRPPRSIASMTLAEGSSWGPLGV